ncbi:hypothetical protein B566_EDAN009976 [Ephemera danica]|nr:hypothetical protein B566_EDAN009976 [Ephemera danica]
MAAINFTRPIKKSTQNLVKFLSTIPLQNEKQSASKMLAWQLTSYGDIKALELNNNAKIPFISKPSDVLVKVSAASVNPIDNAMLGGYGSSLLGGMREVEQFCRAGRSPLEFPLTLGRDFAGEVVECGLEVRDLRPGDQVWGVVAPHQQGSHAEYVLASASTICKRPEGLSALDASSLPYAALTAWSSLWLSAGLFILPIQGKRVLLLGASGGVGTVAVQLLKAWGAQVTATCRTDAVTLVESLGADTAVDYTQPEANRLIKEEGPYDIILNASGLQGTPHLDCMKEWSLARYVTITSPLLKNTDQYGLIAGTVKSALDLLMPNIEGVYKRGATVRWGFFVPSQLGLSQITELVQAGKINPVIDQRFSFNELPAAYQRLKDGHVRGKIVHISALK